MASETLPGPDPTLYLYTSLTAGSSHIITATSRLETILKANKVAFRAIDCATDEKARNLWSRRSKGRKIPGLVKYGQVIGDLEEVEEWNEYGEIKENIDNVSDLFGDTPMTDTPMPPPAPITIKDPLAKASEPPSRSSSEQRHISISEPKDRDRSNSPTSAVKNLKDETPISVAMRQAGAEAAAKAGQRNASATSSLKSTSTTSAIPSKRDSSEVTPTASATKMSIDAEDPSEATEITAAKTPAQLASEGAKRTSVEKLNEQISSETLNPEPKSKEEQVLEARRSSSMVQAPSRLAQETTIDEIKSPELEEAVASEINLPATAPKVGEGRPSHHRGSSLSEASKEEIKELEQKLAIKEESEEDSDNTKSTGIKKSTTKSTTQATDEAEDEVLKGSKPQDQKARDVSSAGVSASTALFLSPNSNSNPNRLSADSASVYSFFDTAFSPAPLFSGSKHLDLDLSFMSDLSSKDTRTSISTYGTNEVDFDSANKLTNGFMHDHTPRQSQDTHRTERGTEKESEQELHQEQDSPRREILSSIPVIAPLRTPARRQASEPLLSSTQNGTTTPASAPLPLNIRKSPNNHSTSSTASSSTQSPSKSTPQLPTAPPPRSQPQLPTQSAPQIPPESTTITSPISPSLSNTSLTSPALASSNPSTPVSATESRSLRFKKSIRSLRSKKSTQKLNSNSSPTREMPPNLPPQRQLKELRAVSDNYDMERGKREKSGMKNLLCF